MSNLFELAVQKNPGQRLINLGVDRVVVEQMQSVIEEATSFDDIGTIISRKDLNMGGSEQLASTLIRSLYEDDPIVREFFQSHLNASPLPHEVTESYLKNGLEGLISYRFSHPEIDGIQIERFVSMAKIASYNFLRTYFGFLTYFQDYKVDLPKPDMKDPLAWAKVGQARIDWLRSVCPQAGFDATQVILGQSLGDIYGDDPNSFGMSHQPEYIEEKRKTLEIVMNTRTNTPEIPEYIRKRLAAVREHVLAIDWTTEDGWQEAKDYYEKKAAGFVQHQIALHEEYRAARRLEGVADLVLSTAWHTFLGEK